MAFSIKLTCTFCSDLVHSIANITLLRTISQAYKAKNVTSLDEKIMDITANPRQCIIVQFETFSGLWYDCLKVCIGQTPMLASYISKHLDYLLVSFHQNKVNIAITLKSFSNCIHFHVCRASLWRIFVSFPCLLSLYMLFMHRILILFLSSQCCNIQT